MTDRDFENYLKGVRDKPHLVILGAGATMATIPNGDKNGRKSAVMDNFIEELGLQSIIQNICLTTKSNNLEDIYSELSEKQEYVQERKELEKAIRNHFESLKLPDSPTIYDLLVLSLRRKDCIASFNWDDLLIQARQRVQKITDDLPNLLFLHGNVSMGGCLQCGHYGALYNKCAKCGKPFVSVPLLFPVRQKDYSSHPTINTQWLQFEEMIKRAGLLTIFGYNAPDTDVDAIHRMKNAFSTESKFFHEIEVVDIGDQSKIEKKWSYFGERAHWHFKVVVRSFFNTYLAEFPRRSIEGYYKRNLEGWWGKPNIHFNVGFDDLKKTVSPLIEAERQNNFDII